MFLGFTNLLQAVTEFLGPFPHGKSGWAAGDHAEARGASWISAEGRALETGARAPLNSV